MIAFTSDRALALVRRACGPALLAAALALQAVPGAQAQGMSGSFLIYGNFCGPGNRGPGYPPIDALDRACANHDACSPSAGSGQVPRCACNRRLTAEARLVARDPHTLRQTRDMAEFIADWAASAPCN